MAVAELSGRIFIGADAPHADQLARTLAATTSVRCPDLPPSDTWDWDWSVPIAECCADIAALPVAGEVVVCTWSPAVPISPLIALEPRAWRQLVEWPSALWFATLVAAAERCRDGGSVVVVVDRPASLDAIGRGASVVVADGVTNVVSSLAAREGGRGVRVNAVATSLGIAADGLPGSAPPLSTFPGRVDVEVAGAVRALLSPDTVGITGSVLAARSGRR